MEADDHRTVLLRQLRRLLLAGVEQLSYALPLAPLPGAYQNPLVPRLSIVTAGAKHIAFNDGSGAQARHLSARSAIFMPPGGWTQPRYDSPREIVGIVFHRDYTRYLWSCHDGSGPPRAPDAYVHAPVTMQGACAHVLQALCARASERRGEPAGQSDRELFMAMVRMASDCLEQAVLERSGRARATWESLREYLAEHLHQPLGREAIAKAFDLHPNYLSTLFMEQGGESFAHFLTRLRMERAARMLRDDRRPIAAVAAECGYSDGGYFIKVFRRFHRTTPGAFRRQG